MENHELRLTINATAARSGSRQFVAAVNSIRASLKGLQRDADGVFSSLRRQANAVNVSGVGGGGGFGGGGLGGGSSARTAANSGATRAAERMERAQLAAANAIRQASVETANLQNKLSQLGARSDVVHDLSRAFVRLRADLSDGVSSTLQVQRAMQHFNNTTAHARVNIANLTVSQRQSAAAAREMASAERAAANEAATAKKRAANAARALAAAEKAAAAEARRIEQDMRSAAGAANAANRSWRSAAGGLRGLENAFSLSFQAASAFRVALGSITLGSFTKSVFTAGDALMQFKTTMEVASGSTEAAAQDLVYIDTLAAKLGTNLSASRDAFSKFAVSAQIAGVSGDQTRKIFEAVSTSMAVLGRGTEDQKLAFLALEQMMSKGVISAEELRRQLGERLPGAVSLMARSIGVSVSELQKLLKEGKLISSEVLPKFADELNRTFGSQLERTFSRAGSNLGRLGVEFQKFLEKVAGAGFMDALASQFRDLTTLFRSEEIDEFAYRLGSGLADAANAIGDAIQFIVRNFDTIADYATAGFWALMVRQVALLGQSLFLTGQQAPAAAGKMAIFIAATTKQEQQAKLSASAAALQAVGYTRVAKEATRGARAIGFFGKAFGALGKFFGFLGGPIGIALTALSFLPLALADTNEEADKAASIYSDAMQRMNTASFSFINTAREIGELNAFDKLSRNITALFQASDIIEETKKAEASAESLNKIFKKLDSTLATDVSKNLVKSIQTMVEDLRDLVPGSDAAVQKIQDIVTALADLRTKGGDMEKPREQLDALDKSMRRLAIAHLTMNKLFADNVKISGVVGDALYRNTAIVRQLGTDINILLKGTKDLTAASPELKKFFAEFGDDGSGGIRQRLRGIHNAVNTLRDTLRVFRDSGLDINRSLRVFMRSLPRSTESALKLQEALRAAHATATRYASDPSLSARQKKDADSLVNSAEKALEYVNKLIELQAAQTAAARSGDDLKGSLTGVANSAASAAVTMQGYISALGTISGLHAAASKASKELRKDFAKELEIAKLSGKERAVAVELYSGKTGKALEKIRADIVVANTELSKALKLGDAPVGIKNDLLEHRNGLLREENNLIKLGTKYAEDKFDADQKRNKSARKGGGARTAEEKDYNKLQRSVLRAGEALEKLANAQDVLTAAVAKGKVTRSEATKILTEYVVKNAEALVGEIDSTEAYLSTAAALKMTSAERQATIAGKILENNLTKEGTKLLGAEKDAIIAKTKAKIAAKAVREARAETIRDALKRIDALKEEALALELVTSGQVKTAEAADMMAKMMLASNGAIDAQTMALIRAADAAGVYVEKMKKAAADPVKDWLKNVPTWQEAAKTVERDVFENLSSAISDFVTTGKFDLESFGQAVLKTMADIVADKAVKEVLSMFGLTKGGDLFGGLFNIFKSQGDSAPMGGLNLGGGTNVSFDIGAEFLKGADYTKESIEGGFVTGGNLLQQGFSYVFGGGGGDSLLGQAAKFFGLTVESSGKSAGESVGSSISSAGAGLGSLLMNVFKGAGDLLSSIFNSLTSALGSLFNSIGGSGGLGGIFGGIGSVFSSILGFKAGGLTSAPTQHNVGPAIMPASAFRHAPSYSSGVANTSGIPAMLHDNEAVIPLTAGRKVPVEVSGDRREGGQTVINQTWNIKTQDADSFRKSQPQIAADAASMGQRALRMNR